MTTTQKTLILTVSIALNCGFMMGIACIIVPMQNQLQQVKQQIITAKPLILDEKSPIQQEIAAPIPIPIAASVLEPKSVMVAKMTSIVTPPTPRPTTTAIETGPPTPIALPALQIKTTQVYATQSQTLDSCGCGPTIVTQPVVVGTPQRVIFEQQPSYQYTEPRGPVRRWFGRWR